MLSQCEQAENTMRKKKPKSLKMVAICAFVRKLFNRHSLEKLALNFALKQQAPIMKIKLYWRKQTITNWCKSSHTGFYRPKNNPAANQEPNYVTKYF